MSPLPGDLTFVQVLRGKDRHRAHRRLPQLQKVSPWKMASHFQSPPNFQVPAASPQDAGILSDTFSQACSQGKTHRAVGLEVHEKGAQHGAQEVFWNRLLNGSTDSHETPRKQARTAHTLISKDTRLAFLLPTPDPNLQSTSTPAPPLPCTLS